LKLSQSELPYWGTTPLLPYYPPTGGLSSFLLVEVEETKNANSTTDKETPSDDT